MRKVVKMTSFVYLWLYLLFLLLIRKQFPSFGCHSDVVSVRLLDLLSMLHVVLFCRASCSSSWSSSSASSSSAIWRQSPLGRGTGGSAPGGCHRHWSRSPQSPSGCL